MEKGIIYFLRKDQNLLITSRKPNDQVMIESIDRSNVVQGHWLDDPDSKWHCCTDEFYKIFKPNPNREYFTITTNREAAEKIIKQCAFEEKYSNRSFSLGKVHHETNYSTVQIIAKQGGIKVEDIFWLGYFASSQRFEIEDWPIP